MFYNNEIYKDDMEKAANSIRSLNDMRDSSVLITGATGLIGSFIVDMLMYCNDEMRLNVCVYASGRNRVKLETRFVSHLSNKMFNAVEYDVNNKLSILNRIDYIIHAASNAYPTAYSTDPVGTITGNVFGIYNLLEYARVNSVNRVLLVSSGEVYGEGTPEIDLFDEAYSGYIDCTSTRSCYPTSKRMAETLCVSYTKQYDVDTVIARPCHIYGPTVTADDNRASAQFINNVVEGQNIVMKSEGLQQRSYCYVADCASAMLTILLHGTKGNAYNIANSMSNVTISELAQTIAGIAGKKVVYDVPDAIESAGYTPITRGVLDPDKLRSIGWTAHFDIHKGIEHTIRILLSMEP